MRRKSSSTAMIYSLTEFSYLLLFIFIGASVIIGGEYMKIREINNSLNQKIDKLENESVSMKKEIEFLENTLKELKNGVVPCCKRPDSPVPEIAGTIIIKNFIEYSLVHHSGQKLDILSLAEDIPAEEREEMKYKNLRENLLKMFHKDMAYSKSKNCYIRVKIENHTSSYTLYRKYADVLKALRIVLVNECSDDLKVLASFGNTGWLTHNLLLASGLKKKNAVALNNENRRRIKTVYRSFVSSLALYLKFEDGLRNGKAELPKLDITAKIRRLFKVASPDRVITKNMYPQSIEVQSLKIRRENILSYKLEAVRQIKMNSEYIGFNKYLKAQSLIMEGRIQNRDVIEILMGKLERLH